MEFSTMKKIAFHQIELFLMFAFSLQEKYNLKPHRDSFERDGDNFVLEYPALICDEFMLVYKEDGIGNMEYLTTVDIFVSDFYSMYDEKGDNDCLYNEVYNYIDNHNLKCLIVDAEGEMIIHFQQFRDFELWKEEVSQKKGVYVISQRNFLEESDNKILNGHGYLSLLYYFYHLSDNLFLQPKLPNLYSKDKKYDFISYLGLNTDFKSKSEWRGQLLLHIDFNDKKLYTPVSYNTTKPIQRMMDDFIGWPTNNFGSYNWFSLIESEQAKIKLVFETESPDEVEDDIYSFLTEKTLKCFLHNQPYFIFHKKVHRTYLKDLGFKFLGGDTYQDTIQYISDMCKTDIDVWVNEHKDIFEHNKNLMYDIIFDSTRPHIKLLEHIINET